MNAAVIAQSPEEVSLQWKYYSDYKTTTTNTLNAIPSHWSILAIKHVAHLKSGTSITSDDIREEGAYPVYGGNGLRGYTNAYTHDGTFPLIGRQGALCGNVNYGQGQFWASEHAVVVVPRRNLNVYWLGELLRAINLNQYSISAAQPGLSVDVVKNLYIPLPPISEQHAIAAFLDRETAKIDALVAKKERLIALLQEKRTALISQAVTKGLDPSVPMKESGVEWIGEIPAHWRLKRLRFWLKSIEQGWSPECENRPAESHEWGVLKVGCVNGAIFNQEENKALPATLIARSEYEIFCGDILMSRANTRELLGSASVVNQVRPHLLLCDKLYRLRIQPNMVMAEYLVLVLSSAVVRFQMERAATGASNSMQNISQDTVLNIVLPLPPLHEQTHITAQLDCEMTRLDTLATKVRQHIDTLREYRTALISAAVTGKIDVRGEVG